MKELLSEKITNLPESATLAMAAKAREMKEKGIDVISLSLGEPDFKTPKHIQEGAIEAIRSEKYFSYPPVNGYLNLREAISKKFEEENNLRYSPDQIVVSNGAKQSIANVFQALLNPGDEVIVFTPYWVSYRAMIEMAGGIPIYISGDLSSDFKASAVQLRAALSDRTKAVIFSSPCNPTGSVFSKDELLEFAEVLQAHPNIMVIADEIYELINFRSTHVSMGSLPGMQDQTVTVNGFSKGFAMTGWRVGYIGAPLWLAKAASKMQGQYTSANCSVAQRAALTALNSSKEASLDMVEAYRERKKLVQTLLESIPGFQVNDPEGAFYFFPDISTYFGKSQGAYHIKDASDFCLYLLEEAHVSLVTGQAFGAGQAVRLSYAASKDDLTRAIDRMKEALKKLS